MAYPVPMINARGPLLPAVLAGLLGLTLAGCGPEDDKADAKAAGDPKTALTGSTAALKEGNYAFADDAPDLHATGVIHLPSKSASMKVVSKAADAAGTAEVRLVEPDRWVKFTMGGEDLAAGLSHAAIGDDPNVAEVAASVKEMTELFSGKYWMHFDLSKVKGDTTDLDLTRPDVTGATSLLGAVVTAQGDAHTITGTLDATKTTDAGPFDTKAIKAMGPAAAALPYTATLDDKGRLTKLEITAPKAGSTPAGSWTIAIIGYGEQAAQAKPTGEIKDLPDSGYALLGE
jgi:hypothetical protein